MSEPAAREGQRDAPARRTNRSKGAPSAAQLVSLSRYRLAAWTESQA
jgi:hypothetical protein